METYTDSDLDSFADGDDIILDDGLLDQQLLLLEETKKNSKAFLLPKSITTTAATTTTTTSIITTTPTERLHSLFPPAYRHRCRIVPPTEERLNNYTMDIVTAVRSSDLDQLQTMLAAGRSLDACNRNGETLLHLACRRSTVATVEWLLDHGRVPASLADSIGRTALFDACWRPTADVEILDALLQRVSTVLLLGEDMWGNCCLDYVRPEDNGVWLHFLEERKEKLKQWMQQSIQKERPDDGPVGTIG